MSALPERLIGLADAGRRACWAAMARWSVGRRALTDRSLRIGAIVLAQLALALALTAVAPLWLLLLSPIVVGTPHVLSDVRCLLTHPAAPLRVPRIACALAPLAGMLAARVVAALGGPHCAELEVSLGALTVCAAVALAPAARRVRHASMMLAGALGAAGVAHAEWTLVAFAHAHNGIALVMFFVLAPDAALRRARWITLIAFALGLAAIAGGGLDGAFSPEHDAAGLRFEPLLAALAPGVDGVWGPRLVLLFAFAQAVHYTLWLRVIPQAPRYRCAPTPSSLSRTALALRAEWGRVGLWAALALCAATPLVAAAVSPAKTRDVYLSLVTFHGWIELAALAFLAALALGRRGRAP